MFRSLMTYAAIGGLLTALAAGSSALAQTSDTTPGMGGPSGSSMSTDPNTSTGTTGTDTNSTGTNDTGTGTMGTTDTGTTDGYGGTGSTGMGATTAANENRGTDWGWLGLLGLAGLAGLLRRPQEDRSANTYRERGTAA